MAANLHDGPQWYPTLGIHALPQSPSMMNQGCSLWLLEYGRGDGVSLPKLDHKIHPGFCFAFSLRLLLWRKPATILQGPQESHGEARAARNWGPCQAPGVWATLEALVKPLADVLMATSDLEPEPPSWDNLEFLIYRNQEMKNVCCLSFGVIWYTALESNTWVLSGLTVSIMNA